MLSVQNTDYQVISMKIKNGPFNIAWLAAIAICVVLSVVAVIFASCSDLSSEAPGSTADSSQQIDHNIPVPDSGDPDQSGDAQAGSTTPETPDDNGARLSQTADAGREYLDKIVFLGDSTTYGIGVYYEYGFTELVPDTQIWTPASGTLTLSYYSTATIVYPETGEELSIVDAVTRAKPEIMILTLGVNGVSFMDEEWFIRDYTDLVKNIQQASPDTKIILNSIYPVATTYEYLDDINNDRIRAANIWIEQVAQTTGVKFLNTYEVLVGPDGWLPATYHNGDGLHLCGESFEIVMEYIRTHAYN